MQILRYLTPSGRDEIGEWLAKLRDPHTEAKIRFRIDRLAAANFGDCKPIGNGVWELRINAGPGYRVCYAMAGRELVVLLCGGDKRTQRRDIRRAFDHWQDFQTRSK
jgi:putative addiction module killer protein